MNSANFFSNRKALLAWVLAAALCLGVVLSPYGGVLASAQNEDTVPDTSAAAPEGNPSEDDGLPIILILPEEPEEGGDALPQEQENEEETDIADAGDEDEEEPAEAVEEDEDNEDEEHASQQNRGASFAMPFSTPINVASSQDIQNAIDADTSGVLTLNITQGFGMGADPILINKDITIYFTATGGPVTVTAYADKAYHRYFNIPSGKVNLIFDKDNIRWYGFINEGVVGGGFDIGPGADVFITGLDMEQANTNHGTASSLYPDGGGGGFFVQGKLEIANSLLVAMNSFNKSGGGFFVDNGGQLKISGTENEPVTVKRGIAGGNGGEGGGGAIYVAKGGSLDATYLVVEALTDNYGYESADVGGKVISGRGGAIYWEVDASAKGTQSLTNSILSYGSASSGGGGAYIVVNKGATLQAVEDNVFDGNTSMFPGGGLRLDNYGTVKSFTNNSFTNNVSYSGSAMYVIGDSPLTITNTTIDNNRGANSYHLIKAVDSSAGILNENVQLTIAGSETSISGNVIQAESGGPAPSGGNGAGIYVRSGKVIFAGGVIANNIAKVNGGGVYVAAGASFLQTGGTIRENNANLGGGIFIAQGGEAELRSGTIEANTTNGTGGGAAVHNLGTLYITGTTIQNHVGDGKNGTVMLGDNSTGYMSGGLITNNTLTAADTEGSLGRGAGIYLRVGAEFTMTGGTISHNTANRGAGIYVQEDSTANITGGVIEYNTATLFGGGIYLLRNNKLMLDGENDLLIRGNTAGTDGGAIVSYGQPDPLKPTVRADNTIDIRETSGSLVIDNNHAGNTGGAIHIRLGSENALNITGGTFTNNSADKEGGAIYLQERTIEATISGGSIGVKGSGNSAGTDGGGIYNSAAILTITGTAQVSGNTAARHGGGISSDLGKNEFVGQGITEVGGETIIDGPVFANNEAKSGNGGGIYIFNGTLEMKHVAVKDNKAGNGGGLYVIVGQQIDSDPTDAEAIESIDENLFSGNAATLDGGGLYVYIRSSGLSKSISGNVVENNTAGSDGGGVYAAYYGEGQRISANIVRGNKAEENGGGLYIEGTMRRYFAITSDTVVDNEAKGYGGGLFVSGTILRVYNTSLIPGNAEISGNKAAYGGGIYASGTAKVVVEQGEIKNNTATSGHGGGIYSNATLVDISELRDDPVNGTAGYVDITVQVDVAEIAGNEAKNGNGGGIYIAQRGGLQLRGSTIDGNTARSGGGMYVSTYSFVDINTSTNKPDGKRTSISGNQATNGNGGGLYVGNGVLDLEYADINSNTASGSGGGLFMTLQKDGSAEGEAQRLVYNVFDGNKARDGGGMHVTVLEGGTSKVIGGNTLQNNTATNAGGGVWLKIEGTGKSVYNNTITQNTARIGGGIYITGEPKVNNTMSFANDEISYNHAYENGGGVYVDNSAMLLFDAAAVNKAANDGNHGDAYKYLTIAGEEVQGSARIVGNTAGDEKDNFELSTTGSGGGIYLHGSELKIQNGTISFNGAGLHGGGIYADEDSIITMDYNPYAAIGTQPAFALDLSANTALQGNGGGMYILPGEDNKYQLTNLTVQSNTAENGNGGGIFVSKNRIHNLSISNSLFGTPKPEDPTDPAHDPALYNVAQAGSYVERLYEGTTDQVHIDNHPNLLTGIQGHSPSQPGGVWAEVSGSNSDRLYYNNFDIAFYNVDPDNITVNYYANGGQFDAKYGNREHVYGSGIQGEKINAPDDPTHSNAVFIGWFRAPYTDRNILDGDYFAYQDLDTLSDTLGYTIKPLDTDQDFYAAWLTAPTVNLAYDVDTEVVVYSLEKAKSVILYLDGVEVAGVVPVRDTTDPRKWTFTVGNVLQEGMELSAIQTIETQSGISLNANRVTSLKGYNTVLPTYRVYYHVNESYLTLTDKEKNRLEEDWLPEDLEPYRSSEQSPLPFTVLGPTAGVKGPDGYVFLGWSKNITGGELLNAGGPDGTIFNEDVNLYAQWEKLYTLTYHANTYPAVDTGLADLMPENKTGIKGGTAVPIGDWAMPADQLRLPDATYAYRFLYWTVDASGQGQNHYLYNGQRTDGHYDTITVNENRDLYAQWERASRVIYNLNYPNAPADTEHGIIDPDYYVLGQQFKVHETEPERQGYTFIGWNYYPNASADRWYRADNWYAKPDEGTTTLHAQWVRNITITYNGNGNTSGLAPDGEDDWIPGDKYIVEGDGTLEREGYTFIGWSLNEDGLGEVYGPKDTQENTYVPYVNTIFYAIWKLDVLPNITKRSNEQEIKPGQSFTYTITVENNGPEAVDAVVTDELPSYLTCTGSDHTNLGSDTSLRFEGSIEKGAAWKIEVYVTLSDTYRGENVNNTAHVIFNNDPELVDEDEDITPVRPDLVKPEISKESGQEMLEPGDRFLYTIQVQNKNDWRVNAVVTDDLPEGITYDGSEENTNLGSKTALRFEKDMQPNETWTIRVWVILSDGYTDGWVENTASVIFNEDPELEAEDEDATPVIHKPAITKESNELTVLPGESFTYTLTVENTGGVAVAAVVTDDLPEGLTYLDSEDENLGSKTSLRFEKTMQPETTWIIEVEVALSKSYEGETIENTARVVFNNNPELSDQDDDETPVGVLPELVVPEITKTANRQVVLPGESFAYTLTVRNRSERDVDAVVTDALPKGLTLVKSSHENLGSNTDLRFEKPLEGGETWTITLEVALAADYTGTSIHNVAVAVFNQKPELTAEDDETTTVGLLPQPVAPEITKTSGEDSLVPGQSFTYTITVRNNSALTVEAVVTDTLPEGLSYKGSSDKAARSGQTLRWEKTLGPGEAWEIRVDVKLDGRYTEEQVRNTAVAVFNGDAALTARDSDTTPVALPDAPPPAADNTPTGDAAQLMLWTCIALASLFGMGSMVFVNIRRRQQHRKRYAWYYRKGGK